MMMLSGWRLNQFHLVWAGRDAIEKARVLRDMAARIEMMVLMEKAKCHSRKGLPLYFPSRITAAARAHTLKNVATISHVQVCLCRPF